MGISQFCTALCFCFVLSAQQVLSNNDSVINSQPRPLRQLSARNSGQVHNDSFSIEVPLKRSFKALGQQNPTLNVKGRNYVTNVLTSVNLSLCSHRSLLTVTIDRKNLLRSFEAPYIIEIGNATTLWIYSTFDHFKSRLRKPSLIVLEEGGTGACSMATVLLENTDEFGCNVTMITVGGQQFHISQFTRGENWSQLSVQRSHLYMDKEIEVQYKFVDNGRISKTFFTILFSFASETINNVFLNSCTNEQYRSSPSTGVRIPVLLIILLCILVFIFICIGIVIATRHPRSQPVTIRVALISSCGFINSNSSELIRHLTKEASALKLPVTYCSISELSNLRRLSAQSDRVLLLFCCSAEASPLLPPELRELRDRERWRFVEVSMAETCETCSCCGGGCGCNCRQPLMSSSGCHGNGKEATFSAVGAACRESVSTWVQQQQQL